MSSLEKLLDKLWPCRCWYCRLFTRRILKHFIAKAIVEKPVVEEKPMEVEAVSTAAPSMDVVKEITELKKGFDELKKAIAEIKALLSDLTGPYSYYKPPEEEKPVKKKEEITSTEKGVGVKIVERKPEIIPSEELSVSETVKPEETVYEEKEGRLPQAPEEKLVLKPRERGVEHEYVKPPTIGEKMETSPELLSMIRSVQEAVKEERSRLASSSLKQTITIIKTLYELRKIYPRSSIEALLKLIEALNIIPREEVELLKTSMEIVEESLKQGVSPDESVILLYMLLKNLGVRDESLEEELTKTMLKTLMIMRKETRSQKEIGGLDTSAEGGNNKWVSQQQ